MVIEALAPPGPWSKGAAVAPAVESSRADLIVQADADCFTEGLAGAVRVVEDGAPWAIPHNNVHRLTEEGTAATLAGIGWRDQPLDQRPYPGIAGGGIVVASREVALAVRLDPRFQGWGQEDECHAMALMTIVGDPWRGDADLVHLFHPPQERMTRRRGSEASWQLRRRYAAARNDPVAMRALIEESRLAIPASQHPRDDPSPVG